MSDFANTLHRPATVAPRGAQRARREFHVPLALIEGGDAWSDGRPDDAGPLQACLDWAAATAGGDVPPKWASPPREQVEAWVPSGGMAIQSGPLLRQGTLEYASNRLGLAIPIATEVSAEISPARRGLLRRVLADAELADRLFGGREGQFSHWRSPPASMRAAARRLAQHM